MKYLFISLGLDGLLSRIKLLMRLYINIIKNNYSIYTNFHLYEHHFYFYLKVGIHLKLKKISFKFDFYLFYIVIPHFSLDVYFYKKYSFRNKLLENSSSAKLNLFGLFKIKLDSIPKLIDKKIFSKIEEKE